MLVDKDLFNCEFEKVLDRCRENGEYVAEMFIVQLKHDILNKCILEDDLK